jgi:hypothetical protein
MVRLRPNKQAGESLRDSRPGGSQVKFATVEAYHSFPPVTTLICPDALPAGGSYRGSPQEQQGALNPTGDTDYLSRRNVAGCPTCSTAGPNRRSVCVKGTATARCMPGLGTLEPLPDAKRASLKIPLGSQAGTALADYS